MKPLYFLLFLLVLTLGCKHEPLVREFTVVCDFVIFEPHLLLITNEVGDVVHEIPVQSGTSTIYERFRMPTDDPDATFSLHLLQQYSVDWTRYFNVYSHCGVKNGMHIVLGAPELIVPQMLPSRWREITIRGVQSLQFIQYAGNELSHNFSWSSKSADSEIYIHDNAALYLRVRANNEVRQAIIPDIGTQDKIELDWADFVPEKAIIRDIAMPPSSSSDYFRCSSYAVSPDFQKAMPLSIFGWTYPDSMLHLRVPAGLPSDWQVYLSVKNEQGLRVEKLFRQDVPISLSPSVISIKTHQVNDKGELIIRSSGPADMLRASAFSDEVINIAYFQWTLDARPDRFDPLPIPKIQQYLPLKPGIQLTDLFKNFSAEAFHSGQFDYLDMARGFPWRSTEPFVLGRGGYKQIRK